MAKDLITFEKDKIYKAIHTDVWGRKRNYIIFSPLRDITFNRVSTTFKTHFTVCFDDTITTKYDTDYAITGFDSSCKLGKLNNKDLADVRRAMRLLGDSHHYNRKLNKLVYGV